VAINDYEAKLKLNQPILWKNLEIRDLSVLNRYHYKTVNTVV